MLRHAAACFQTPMCSSKKRVLRHAAAAHACSSAPSTTVRCARGRRDVRGAAPPQIDEGVAERLDPGIGRQGQGDGHQHAVHGPQVHLQKLGGGFLILPGNPALRPHPIPSPRGGCAWRDTHTGARAGVRGREAGAGLFRAVARAVTGGWRAGSVAVLAVAKRVGGRWGAGRSGWGTDRHSLEAGAASTIRERRPAGGFLAQSWCTPYLKGAKEDLGVASSPPTPLRSGEPGNFFSGVRKETP